MNYGHQRIKVLVLALCILSSPYVYAVEYTGRSLHDPFGDSSSSPGPSVKEEITGMSLSLEGLVWDSKNPAAIISGKVVKIGSKIKDAEVLDINKEGVKMRYKSQEFDIRLKKRTTT